MSYAYNTSIVTRLMNPFVTGSPIKAVLTLWLYTAEMEAVHLVNRWTNTGRQRLNTLLATIVVSAYYLNSIGYVLHSYSHLPLLYM